MASAAATKPSRPARSGGVSATRHSAGGKIDARRMWALRRRFEQPRALPFLLRPGLASRSAADLAEYRALTVRLYHGIAAASGCRMLVDNSKLPNRVVLLHGVRELDVRVLHLVRSSYGVCYSHSKQVARADAQEEMPRDPVARSALRWTAANAAFDLFAWGGVPTLPVRYEKFITQPADELRRIVAFLGRPADAGEAFSFLRGREVELGADHSVWGNPMRLRVGWERLRPDDEWRAALSRRDKRLITAVTASWMLRYGYRLG